MNDMSDMTDGQAFALLAVLGFVLPVTLTWLIDVFNRWLKAKGE